MNGHLSIEKLKEKEAEIFGGSGEKQGRSRVVIKYPKIIKKDIYQISLMPHHDKNYCNRNNPNCFYGKRGDSKYCYKSKKQKGVLYNFQLEINFDPSFIENLELESLIKIVFILGGLGKRSRRGFGSVKIKRIKKGNDNFKDFNFDYSLKSISDLLNGIHSEAFEPESDRIIMKYSPHTDSKYPYIKEIQIGSNPESIESILSTISEESSKNDCYYTGFAENVRENNRKKAKRFASPIFVSVIPDGNQVRPIITTLNCAFEDNVPDILKVRRKKIDCSKEFKNAILEKEVKNG
jgi:CRISPR-associated protein Cmr1